jgi:hypothetical protein
MPVVGLRVLERPSVLQRVYLLLSPIVTRLILPVLWESCPDSRYSIPVLSVRLVLLHIIAVSLCHAVRGSVALSALVIAECPAPGVQSWQ